MRKHTVTGALMGWTVLMAGLVFSPAVCAQQQTQPPSQNCGAAAAPADPNTISGAAQNAKTAFKNIGSVFSKKKSPETASSQPCPPAATAANPGSSTADPPASGASQPASSASASTPATQGSQDAAPFNPDSGTSKGANAPPDFSKLPDIGGVLRIGLSDREARAAMLKMHPGYKVTPGPVGTLQDQMGQNRELGGVRGQFWLDSGGHLIDQTFAFYTMSPTKQEAFTVTRSYPYAAPGIDKLKLIEALRQKYGPETKAEHRVGANDVNIQTIYWAYDEQGNHIASDRGAAAATAPPFGCPVWGATVGGTNIWVDMADAYRLNSLPPATFCDTIVLLSVILGPGPVVRNSVTEIDDHALLRRAVIIAGDAAKSQSQKQMRQQIDQSKQAKPSL